VSIGPNGCPCADGGIGSSGDAGTACAVTGADGGTGH
jgi:hypothetical protein